MTAARTRELCIMACVFCKDPLFHSWMYTLGEGRITSQALYTEASAKAFILSLCQVTSRNALDTDPAAAERFHTLVRLPFLAWKEASHA